MVKCVCGVAVCLFSVANSFPLRHARHSEHTELTRGGGEDVRLLGKDDIARGIHARLSEYALTPRRLFVYFPPSRSSPAS